MTARSIDVIRDLVYGEAPVGHGNGVATPRPLRMDAYLPTGPATAPRPALLMSHGGAYHRGSKEEDLFEQDGWVNTPVADWCRRFAERGYACFSVGYRLTQESPAPQARPIKIDRARVARGRIDHVRGLLGLPVATDAALLDGMEAAFADVAAACRFVHANAARFGVDPARIALGGFSAGAFASIYAAHALGAPAAAIVSLSGGMDAVDAAHYLRDASGPPMLLLSAEHDLPGIAERSDAVARAARAAGVSAHRCLVPGAPHFYPADAALVALDDTPPPGATVEAAIAAFLDDTMGAADVALLEAFADAWNRHDADALMAMMADDCEFRSFAGPDACGTRHVGRAAVRAAYARVWADFPDAAWNGARHFVSGDRGLSEWTFTGTRAADGARVETGGCDVFTFEGGRIRIKDSYRKARGGSVPGGGTAS